MYKHINSRFIAFVAATALVAACASAENEPEQRFTVDRSAPEIVSDLSSPPKPSPSGQGISRLVEMAKADLAANLGIDSSEIGVSEAEYVTWRNSSIGCPAPETAYMDVLAHGSRIVLQAGGSTFHYHSAGNVPPTYCPKPSANKPLPYAPGEA